jgi:hypothetical protein
VQYCLPSSPTFGADAPKCCSGADVESTADKQELEKIPTQNQKAGTFGSMCVGNKFPTKTRWGCLELKLKIKNSQVEKLKNIISEFFNSI